MSQSAVATPPRGADVPAHGNVQFWALALAGSVLLAAIGHLLIKAGLNAAAHGAHGFVLSLGTFHYTVHPTLPLGLVVYALGTAMWIFAVSRRDISYLYPLTALNYAAIALGGRVLFGEAVSAGRCVGIAVVIVGVILMQWAARKECSK
jgi:multidrug transporter EmrE-like cation transporter